MFTLKHIQFQYVATLISILGIICAGMNVNWPTPSLPYLLSPEYHIRVTESDGSWFAVLPYISGIIGCLTAWKLVDKIGRKSTLLLATPFYLIGWALIGLANNLVTLYVARFVSGIGDGIVLTISPMYLAEIADVNVRGLLSTSIIVAEIMGLILTSVIGAYLSIHLAAFVTCAIPVIFCILFYFMPESPYFLSMKNKPVEATEALMKLRGANNVDDEFNRIQITIEKEFSRGRSVRNLFLVASNCRAVYIVFFLSLFQLLTGVVGITAYVTMIFKEADSGFSPSLSTIIYSVLVLISSSISACIVDKVGRRPLLVVSYIGVILTLICNTIYFYFQFETSLNISGFKILPVIFLCVYIFVYGLGLGTVPMMIVGELFPVDVKAFALCLAYIYYGLLVCVVTKCMQIIMDGVGLYVAFLVFSIFSCVGFIYTIYFVPETKGKSFEEIQNYLKGEQESTM